MLLVTQHGKRGFVKTEPSITKKKAIIVFLITSYTQMYLT